MAQTPPVRKTSFLRILMVGAALVLGTVLLLSGQQTPLAATPAAGTQIGNQASATYTDASGVQRTVTSNVVTTVVQQVYALQLQAPNAKYATPGSPIYFPHTVTNNGNGSDSFNLTTALSGQFNFTNVLIYPSTSGNGQPDQGSQPITASPVLASGQSYSFVVMAVVPVTATNAQVGTLVVTATSVGSNTVTANNTDTATITANAVVNVAKAMSANSGLPGSGPYTITLTYTNSGNSGAVNVALTDAMPTGFVYVANSGRWANSGSTVLSDSNTGNPTGLSYQYTAASNTIAATIASVAAGVSTSLTFNVTIAAGQPAGILNNQVTYSYGDGAGNTINGTSNIVPFTVLKVASLTFTGPTAVPSAPQGATISFNNVLKNTGNAPDIFNITLGTNNFPAGTAFVLYQSDGASPLLDTNNDGIPDTGVLQPNASYTVVVKVILPAGASGGGPYTLNKIGTSVNDPTKSATATDTLTTITANSVDLTNNSPYSVSTPAPGQGTGPETNAVETQRPDTGTTTTYTFSLYVNNTSSVSDTYSLQASTDKTFATLVLPTGFTVVFKTDAGTVVSNTGVVAANGNLHINAIVTAPANAAAGTYDVYFKAFSPTTGALDRIHDATTVPIVRGITISPNLTGQVYPNNAVFYTHTITNTGNVLEGDDVHSTVALSTVDSLNLPTNSGWTSVIYYDAAHTGAFVSTDPIISDLSTFGGLAPGQSVTIFVKVYAPSGAAVGAADVTTLTGATTQGTYSAAPPANALATDVTTVIAGQLQMVKTQAIANADGSINGSYTQANLTTGALPGAYIRYCIKLTNVGTANATTIVVSDDTSPYTTYFIPTGSVPSANGPASWTTDGTTFTAATAPASGGNGTISAPIPTLTPGQSAWLYFQVKINP